MSLENAADAHSGPGPWFIAARAGACSDCGHPFDEGDEIRADGWGSWEGRECRIHHNEYRGVTAAERYVGTSDEEMGF